MPRKTLNLSDQVYDYLLSVSLREHPLLEKLREETAPHRWSQMQLAPEQGQFMALLVKLIGAKNILELGVFTGYSSLCMALALPDDGKLIACDINEEYTNVAKRYWQQAGVDDKVELRLAPALKTLESLLSFGESQFDMAFVDAVKEEYCDYYEPLLKLLRPGGVLAVDNVLWSGKTADPDEQDAETLSLRKFNELVHDDQRVDISMLPVGDGLTLLRKK